MRSPNVPVDAAAEIPRVTKTLDRALRRLDIAPHDRRSIVGDVRGDLQSAAAEGVPPDALMGSDVDTFARQAVADGAYRSVPRNYSGVVGSGGLAVAVAVLVGFWLVGEVVQPALASRYTLAGHHPTAGPLVVFTGIALVALLGALAVLWLVLDKRAARRETLVRVAVLAPLAAAGGAAAVVAVANDPSYRTTPGVVVGQVLLVAVPVAASLAAARWWALRSASSSERSQTSA